MATQKEEEDNFIKMFKLVTGVGVVSLRVEFDRYFPPTNLQTLITTHKLKLDKLKTEKRLTAKQMLLLFPPGGSSPKSIDFDITLMICLIRNLTTLTPSVGGTRGFDMPPSPFHTAAGDDIARLKYYRNMLAHADSNKIQTTDFSNWWKDLSESIVRLGGAHFQNDCDVIKSLQIISDADLKTIKQDVINFKAAINDEIRELQENFEDMRQEIHEMKQKKDEMEKNVLPAITAEVQDMRQEVHEMKQKEDEMEKKVLPAITAEVQEVRLKVDDMETEMSEVIPANIQDQIKKKLELWQNEDKMFVSTKAAKHVLECIKENSCVTVTGNAGIGKTFIVRHVALIMKHEGYTVIPTCIPKDIRDFTKSGVKTLFVIDDIGGHFTLNQRYIDDWKLLLPDIEFLFNSHCKCIATCRLQVFKDEKFKDLSLFTLNACNLSSDKLRLTESEKSSLSVKYFGDKSSQVSEMSNMYDFFPLLCSLYDKDKFSDLSLFFSQPYNCYKKELDELLNEDEKGRYKYCVLALVVMFNNKLSKDHLSLDYKKVNYEIILDKCELNRSTSMECLKKALNTLEGTFVVKDGDFYKTIHDKLFDFLAKYFGDKMSECIIDNGTIEFINERILWKSPDNIETDIDFTIDLPDKYLNKYISRLVIDWSDGKVIHLFCSRNFKSPTFIVKLLDHIKQKDKSFQVKLANVTVNTYYHDTTLMASCFIGDVNLTQWILNNTVNNGRRSVFNKVLQWLYRDSIVNQCRNDGTSPVFIACQEGHVNILETLIENKADINKYRNDGASPVYIACYQGHVNILKTLIENKADINKCDNDGVSPVYIACQNGHVNILKTLIENKADINTCRNDGVSPVYVACQNGHVNILKTLIENKADINTCRNDGVSPVYVACQNGHVNILKTLIENKADINKCQNDGVSPVYAACQNGHVNILKTLIENEADINKCMNDGVSPVFLACDKGHVNILETLIENNADINKCGNDGASPVYIACQEGHVNILETLIENKADINKCKNDGASPVYVACYKGHVNILETLIENNADINKCGNDGASPVYIACQEGHVNILETIIKNKADINKCQKNGASPVYIACYKGHVDILGTLIENKADINKCVNVGASPVHIACQEGHVNILKTLIENKADINKCDNDGVSPVYIACEVGHVNILKKLIENKADINKCDNDGVSPVCIACQKGHVNILKTLIENKAYINKCRNDGASPVYIACQEGHVNILKTLIENKADINKCMNDGASPVYIACQEGHVNILKTLIENKADINKCMNDGASPVYIACQEGHFNILKTLIENKADVNKCRNNGRSPLHAACYNNQINVILVLLKLYKKEMIHLCDDWGYTPLHDACNKGSVLVVTSLLQHGANPYQCNNKGKSPFQLADDNGHVDVVTVIKQFISNQ